MSYCTLDELRNQLSTDGVDLKLDDGDADDISASVLEEMDSEIEAACFHLYKPDSLTSNKWVKHKAKSIGAYLLCTRRGNPAPQSVADKYTRALEMLEKVRIGSLLIPRCTMSKAAAPTMSNVRPTLRPFPRTVVEPTRSTGKAEGYNQNNKDPLDRTNTDLNYTI